MIIATLVSLFYSVLSLTGGHVNKEQIIRFIPKDNDTFPYYLFRNDNGSEGKGKERPKGLARLQLENIKMNQ